jgi:hypothetical protein
MGSASQNGRKVPSPAIGSIAVFNFACGFASDESLNLSKRLGTLVDRLATVNNPETVINVLEEVLKMVSQMVSVTCAVLF